jgi:hypothetical protein
MALRTFHLFTAEDKGFELMFAFSTGVFKERHGWTPGRDSRVMSVSICLIWQAGSLHHQEWITHVRFFL